MDKASNDNRTTGSPLDIANDDLCRSEADRELRHSGEPEPLDPDDLPDVDVVKAALKYGRDSPAVKADIDRDEASSVPGIRERD